MPFINGQKMACGPCIRGHRSTKCTHASERVMIPVRKPGRPLTSCACAPGRTCACGSGVRVAIPKIKKCACGPGKDEDKDSTEGGAEQPVLATPALSSSSTATSSPNSTSYRVSKPTLTSRPNGRIPSSLDHVTLDRVDLSSVNIINGYAPAGTVISPQGINGLGTHVPQPVSPATIGYIRTGQTNGYGHGLGMPHGQTATVTYTIDAPRHPSPPQMPYDPLQMFKETKQNGLGTRPYVEVSVLPQQALAPCPNGPGTTNGHVVSTPASTPTFKANGPTTGGGCCCDGASGDDDGKTQTPEAKAGPTVSNPFQYGYLSQFQDIAYHQPTTVTYPAQYGSWQNPINPVIWQQLLAQQSAPINLLTTNDCEPSLGEIGTSHECGCGPGCKCIGCLAHPYNPETLAYINEAYDETSSNSNANPCTLSQHQPELYMDGHQNSTGGPRASTTPLTIDTQQAQLGGDDVQQTSPPATAHTPSDASGITSEEQLSMSDYLFIDMPFDGATFSSLGLCGGDMCACGPDCQCEGCDLHNFPGRGAG